MLPTGVKPGIIRRCALIDALHPALARQRTSPKPLQRQTCSNRVTRRADSESTAGRKITKDSTAASSESTGGAIVPSGVEEKAVVDGRTSAAVEAAADAILKVSLPSPPLQERRPSRPPMPAQRHVESPLDAGKPPNDVPREGGSVNIEEIAAHAGRLTVLQWECVKAWMARVRRVLGADAWKYLGSGRSSCRLREHIRSLILPGGGLGNTSLDLPLNEVERGQDTLDAEVYGIEGSRTGKGQVLLERSPGGWEDHLSQKAALALEAILWILAPQRQRAAMVATIVQDGARRMSSSHTRGCLSPSLRAGRKIDRNNDVEMGSAAGGKQAELGVSLPRVRRFVKACRLVDGVTVLNADIDLAVKRWEEIDRIRKDGALAAANAAPASSCSPPVRPTLGSVESTPCAEIGYATHSAPGSNSASPAHVGDVRPRLCKAVGCSEAALYGAVGPTSKATFCRKHRTDGMADVGSPR